MANKALPVNKVRGVPPFSKIKTPIISIKAKQRAEAIINKYPVVY